ncbi:hypothetical protein IJ117_00370 [Candidatus Saccharibacteria bacterium]|nr:hypothetical protein [Candidatus Saccharibacteria bacterium]
MHKVIQSKLKQAQTKLLYALPIMAIAITLALATSIYLETTVGFTHAEANTASGNGGATVTAAADRDLTVTIHNSEIVLDLTPSQQGVFSSNDFENSPLTVEVATNNPTGYNLNMTTTTTNLTRTAPLSGQTPVIQTLSSSGSFTADNFETNAWGFSLDGINYQAIKASRQINQTIKESNSSVTNISFGVKLNDEIPSGNYKATLTFIATTNPLEANFDTAFDAAGKTQVSYNGQNYYKMQDMSGFICSMVATPTDTTSAESTQLIDTRDNSVYWVSKLLDGNCWMTQNLDLDLSSSVALTNTDTDLNSVTSWTPVRSTINSTAYNNTTSGASGGILTYNGSNSHNGGFAPDFSNSTSSDMTVNANNSPYSADPGYRYVVPKEMSGSNTNWWDNGDTFYYCTNQDTTCGGNSENSHYTMGNYYNFAAASATNNVETTLGGSANVVQNASMPDSICPKGWRLPIAKTTNSEFNTLLGASNYNVISNFNFAGLNAIRIAPLYFVRSGCLYGGTLNDAGVSSRAWSSTISSSAYGYTLDFSSTGIGTADNYYRLHGFPVRCLARTDLTIEDATYLQDVTPEMRQNTAIGTTATVLDKRDNEEYTIGKLEDGNIWLLDNLRLDLGAVSLDTLIGNTNASATTLGYLKNGGGTSPYTATGVTVKTADSGSWINSYDAPYIATSGTGDLGDWTSETVMDSAYHSGAGSGMIGVYYNYCAASAGSYCYSLDSSSGDATEDICPANWHLPSAGLTTGDTGTLCTLIKGSDCASSSSSNPMNLNEATSLQYKLSTPLSGIFINGLAYDQDTGGYFWSSARSDNAYMYYLYVTATGVNPQNNNTRDDGYSVRCVLK